MPQSSVRFVAAAPAGTVIEFILENRSLRRASFVPASFRVARNYLEEQHEATTDSFRAVLTVTEPAEYVVDCKAKVP